MSAGASTRSVAEIVAPFGRLPAGFVMLVADAALAALADAHGAGRVGFDPSPGGLHLDADGRVTLAPASGAAPWLAAPERRALAWSDEPARASDDLFALGATLLELLLARRPLDAGSVEANAAFRARLTAPPPALALCPSLPGVLERVLLALLSPAPSQRADAASLHAVLAPHVEVVRAHGTLADLVRDAAAACARMHETQARAEAERGAALVVQPATQKAGLISLLRAHALLPGQPQVTQLLTQAANAGVIRGARAQPPELAAVLAQIAAAEPAPPVALLKNASALHEQSGDLLEALALHHRVLVAQPQHKILAAKLDELGSARADPTSVWAAGGAWALEGVRAPSAHAASAHLAPASFPVDAGAEAPWRQAVRGAQQAFGDLAPRSRLFLLVLTASALLTLALFLARDASQSGAAAARAQLDVLATQSADCPPGGRAVLLQAWQAARLHEPEAIDRLIANNESVIPMGTRCHAYAFDLSAQAEVARRRKK